MSNSIDISLLNNQSERLAIDFRIKPLGDGAKFYWFFAVDNSYAMKVRRNFVASLQNNLTDDLEAPRHLCKLFKEFEDNVKSTFVTYLYSGFLAKDYAEFYIEYGGISRNDCGEIIEPTPFFIGDVSVKLSRSSSILYFR